LSTKLLDGEADATHGLGVPRCFLAGRFSRGDGKRLRLPGPALCRRHADYYNTWDDAEAQKLAYATQRYPAALRFPCGLKNRYRTNGHIKDCWPNVETRVCSHFYHVGSDESLRNEIDEALLIKLGFATEDIGKQRTRGAPKASGQLSLVMEKTVAYRARVEQ
jgi:hypothetical protein